MQGKVVMVTGATNGIGKVTARELAKMGATLVVVGRNSQKTEATVAEIKQACGHDRVHGMLADLSLMDDVRALAAGFEHQFDRLDVLVNNAGVGNSQFKRTTEGFDATFATNHLSYFLLTNLLLDVLKDSAPARIVNVASEAHRGMTLNFDDLQSEHNWGTMGFNAYGRSKLMNILFTRELAKRLEGAGVTANVLHPGLIATGLWSNSGPIFAFFMRIVAPLIMKSPEQGAKTTLYVASSPEVRNITGAYFDDCQQAAPSAAAQDDEAARKLWEISEEMVGLTVRV